MSSEIYRRLQESQPLQRPAAILSGLWRRGYLRAPHARDRRQDVRISTDDQAYMILPDEVIAVRVLDVSRGGMRIEVAAELLTGSIVRIELGGTRVVAEVRHSTLVLGAYHAGLQIQRLM